MDLGRGRWTVVDKKNHWAQAGRLETHRTVVPLEFVPALQFKYDTPISPVAAG